MSCSEDRRRLRKQSLIRWILEVMDGQDRQGEGRGENGTLRVLKCIFQVQVETG